VLGHADAADDVGLAAAHPARDGEHGETVGRLEPPHDVACLLETDADLEGQARPAQTPLMPREDAAQTAGE